MISGRWRRNISEKTSISFQMLVNSKELTFEIENDFVLFFNLYINSVLTATPDPEFDTRLLSTSDIPIDELFETITPNMRQQTGQCSIKKFLIYFKRYILMRQCWQEMLLMSNCRQRLRKLKRLPRGTEVVCIFRNCLAPQKVVKTYH